MGASSCTESYAMSRTLAEGPKVFAFDALACEALENFDLSVPTADYLQPFPSLVIELPADYSRKRVVPFEEGSHAPDFVVVRHEPEAGCVLLAMHLTSHQVLTRLLKLDPAWTLEEMWEKGKRAWGAGDTLGMTPEEVALGTALSKLALNVCLMATAYGVRCLGPANPSHYERLKRYAKLARKRGREQQEKAEMEVRITPVRYAFAPGGHAVPKRAGHEPARGGRRRLDRRPALAQGPLALAAVRSWAAGAASGGHPLGAGQRPLVRGIACRHGDDVPGAGPVRMVGPCSCRCRACPLPPLVGGRAKCQPTRQWSTWPACSRPSPPWSALCAWWRRLTWSATGPWCGSFGGPRPG
jgi:hypothetical protein